MQHVSIPISAPNIVNWSVTSADTAFDHYSYTISVPPMTRISAKISWNICWYSNTASSFLPTTFYRFASGNWAPYQLRNGCQSIVTSVQDNGFLGQFTTSPTQIQFQPYTNGAGQLRQIVNQVIYAGSFTAILVNNTMAPVPFSFKRVAVCACNGPSSTFIHNVRTPFYMWSCFSSNFATTVLQTVGNVQSSSDSFSNLDVIPGVEIL